MTGESVGSSNLRHCTVRCPGKEAVTTQQRRKIFVVHSPSNVGLSTVLQISGSRCKSKPRTDTLVAGIAAHC